MEQSSTQTWEQMRAQFPEQWLLILEFDTDEFGQISTGLVQSHGDRISDLAKPPEGVTNMALRFTGESTFTGLRSHENHDAL